MENVEAYIRQKLSELDKQKDMQDVVQKGKLSFGIDSATYSHLPAWYGLVKQKKQLIKMFWFGGLFLSVMATLIGGNFFEGMAVPWWKDAIRLAANAGIVFLFAVTGMCFSLFTLFRKTEREVRKLIYQDLLYQLKKENGVVA